LLILPKFEENVIISSQDEFYSNFSHFSDLFSLLFPAIKIEKKLVILLSFKRVLLLSSSYFLFFYLTRQDIGAGDRVLRFYSFI